jgi:ribosomal protein S18 acetylase RimI-like enzyme
MNSLGIEFTIIDKYENRELFEDTITKANEVWFKAFGNKYNYGECPGDNVVIGCINNEIVCCAIIEYYHTVALISCVGSYPQNCGYGTLLMEYIIHYLKPSNISKIHVKIDKNDNSDRLIKFYSKFGFVKQNLEEDEEYIEDDEEIFNSVLYYDSDIEFRMTINIVN